MRSVQPRHQRPAEAALPIEPEPSDYPVTFSVDYPDRKLNRLTTFFRIFTVIPIAIVIALLSGGGYYSSAGSRTPRAGAGVGLLTLPTVLMLLFRKKYPRWWFDWNLEFSGSRTASASTSR